MNIPMDNTNLAYDLTRFDVTDKRRREQQAPESNMHLAPAVSVSKSGSRIKLILAALLSFSAFCAVNVSNTRKDDAARLVEQQQALLQSAQENNALLQNKLDSKVNTAYIEKYAEENLGMTKVSASQKKYISVNTESLVEIENQEKLGFADAVRVWFDGVMEYIGF